MFGFGSTAFGSGSVGPAVSGFEFFIGGSDLKSKILEGSIQVDGAINERSIARFMLVNPDTAPSMGQIVQIRQDGVRIFGGTIDRIETQVDTTRTTIIYKCECIDWQQFLDRRITTKTYTDTDAATIIRDLLDNVIQDEGVAIHALDSGVTFPLVKADEVRVGDLIRDVAEGAGFTYWIDPDRRLHFVATSPDTAPFTLGVGTIFNPILQTTREQYRNVQRVKVTGTAGEAEEPEEVTIERTDTTGISARQSIEGGSGKYMVFDSLTHPSSNDVIELERLGRAFAKLRLTRSAAMRKVLRAGTYTRGLAPGQLGTVDLPEHGVSGSWLITNLRTVREKKSADGGTTWKRS